jgi:hypothetical protein
MGFTVTRQGGTNVDFEEYLQLLRQEGVDLARVPRVPEPDNRRRWLHVWDQKARAQAFAQELRKRTGDNAWKVVEVNGSVTEGPLGPVEIHVAPKRIGWTFELEPLSQMTIQELFPGSCRPSTVSVHVDTDDDLRALQAQFGDLTRQVAVLLTGLSLEQLTGTFGGYRVFDPVAKRELVASQVVQG